MKVGIYGVGVVGGALAEALGDKVPVATYDKFKAEHQDFAGVVTSDVLFLAVPTPTDLDGTQRLEAVEEAVTRLAEAKFRGVVLLKSTVLPGTTQRLAEATRLRLVHAPEFLTERNAKDDARRQRVHLFGGPVDCRRAVEQLFRTMNPENEVHWFEQSSSTELAKYAHNCFLAVKVGFFNDLYELCGRLGASYEAVRTGAVAIGQVGEGHTRVPGPDGSFGFGGMCFPKDTSALLAFATQLGVRMPVLEGTVRGNRARRPEVYGGVRRAKRKKDDAKSASSTLVRNAG